LYQREKQTGGRKTNKQANKFGENPSHLSLVTIKHVFLKMPVNLRTVLSAEPHVAEGQWLQEQLTVRKLPRLFRAGTTPRLTFNALINICLKKKRT
jgi:hypothetical protein